MIVFLIEGMSIEGAAWNNNAEGLVETNEIT
jgi:hypothetical protein